MQKAGWTLGVLAACAGLLPQLEPWAAELAYRILDRGASTPSSADVIVVFSGGGVPRVARALDLLEQGFASRVLFLGTEPEMNMARSLARSRRHWADGRVEFGSRPTVNTADTVAYLADWLHAARDTRALVVSDGYHLPRISCLLHSHGVDPSTLALVAAGRPLKMEVAADRRTVLREVVALAAASAAQALPGLVRL